MSFGPLSGPFPIGFRDESLPSGLSYRLFYPTEASSSPPPSTSWIMSTPYLMALLNFGLGRNLSSIFGGLVHWLLRYPSLRLLEGATPLEGPFPLVLFSHGLGGTRMTYSKLVSNIASHGFVVAALEHLDGSAALAYKEPAQWIPYQHPSSPNVSQRLAFRSSQIHTRTQELRDVHEALTQKTFVDAKRTLLSGHSFGAATIMTLLKEEDPSKFLGGVAYDVYIDPLIERPDVMEAAPALARRTLFLNNEVFIQKMNPELMEQLNQGKEENMWTLKGTLHYCQSDIPTVLRNARLLPYFLKGKFDFDRDIQGFDLSVEAFVAYAKSHLFEGEEKETFKVFTRKNQEFMFRGFKSPSS